MIQNLKAIGIAVACAAATTLVLFGCAGADAGVAGVGGGVGPTCTTVTGGQFSIAYPERSRTLATAATTNGTTTTNLSSALSARIVVPGAASDGSDLTISINRDATNLTAHTETYSIPTIKTGTFTATITAYTLPNQTGAVVGSASVTDTVTCSGATPLAFTFNNVVKSVTVTPANFLVGGSPTQLVFTAKDVQGAVVPVTPGSAIFSIVASPNKVVSRVGSVITLTKDGIVTPGSVGTVQVQAMVDGVTSPSANVTVSAPCTTLSGGSFSIAYPERSRVLQSQGQAQGTTTTNLSSALSFKIVAPGAAPDGSALTININRSATDLTAHTETYTFPTVKTGSYTVTSTAYSLPDQQGAVVGTASLPVTVTCQGATAVNFTFANVVKTVVVTPATIPMGSGAQQLVFTAKDTNGAAVGVSPGSAIWSIVVAPGTVHRSTPVITLTKDGIATPVSAGTVQVQAMVDGVTSAAANVTVTVPQVTYKVVDLGQAFPVTGKAINDNGQAVAYTTTTDGTQFELYDGATGNVLSGLGVNVDTGWAVNNTQLVSHHNNGASYWTTAGLVETPFTAPNGSPKGMNAAGNIVGSGGPGVGAYWSSVTAATITTLPFVAGDQNQYVSPEQINASKLIVGEAFETTQFDACYITAPNAATATLLPALSSGRSFAKAVNDSGVIVGIADSGANELAVMWDSVAGTPHDLGTIGTTGNANAFDINNSGTVVGVDQNSSTVNKAFVYTGANGMMNLFDHCDASRAGWTLLNATAINNNGWIYGDGMVGGVEHVFVAIPN